MGNDSKIEEISNDETIEKVFLDTLSQSIKNVKFAEKDKFDDRLLEFANEINAFLEVIYKESKAKLSYGALPFFWHQDDIEGEWYDYIPTFFSTNPKVQKNVALRYSIFFSLMENNIKFSFSRFACIFIKRLPFAIKININRSSKDNNNGAKTKTNINIFNFDEKKSGTKLKDNELKILKIDLDTSHCTKENVTTTINDYLKYSKVEIGFNDEPVLNRKNYKKLVDEIGKALKEQHLEIISELEKEIDGRQASNFTNFFIKYNKQYKQEFDLDIEGEMVEFSKKFIKFILLYVLLFKDLNEIIFIPSLVFASGDNSHSMEHSFGGLVLAHTGKLPNKYIQLLWILISTKFREWAVWDWSEKAKKEISRFAIRSAVAAIMSRNMSHNLGSHVLSYLKNKLSNTQKMIVDGVFQNLLEDGRELSGKGFTFKLHKYLRKEDSEQNKFSTGDNADVGSIPHAEFLNGLGILLNYLQERQDFIATIASESIPYYSSVNFKDFVFDELNHDLRANRHKDSHEIIQNLLLEYIAKSEEYTREDIVIKFGDFDGEPPEQTKEEPNDLVRMRNIEVDLPGGIIGRQAFFSIIENFIRNSAKHGGGKSTGKKLEIKIDLIENENYYQVLLSDNNKNGDAKTVESIRKALNENIIDSRGRLVEFNKGLKEMKISAGWLSRIPIEEIFIDKEKIDEVLKVDSDEENLRFSFILWKPKKVAIISDKKKEVPKGWKIFSKDDALKCVELSYRFVAIDKDLLLYENELEKIRSKSTVRFIKSYDFDQKNSLELTTIYKNWIENFLAKDSDKFRIIINDDNKDRNIDNGLKEKIFYTGENDFAKYFKEFGNIIFKKHNDSTNLYKKFREKFYKNYHNIAFLEGISGGNSTDRIIRHEELNDLLFYKILESALTKVIIIDERIWSRFAGEDIKDESSIQSIEEIIESLNTSSVTDKQIEYLKEYLEPNGKTIVDDALKYKNYLTIKRYAEHIREKLINKSQESKNREEISLIKEIYEKKNIVILNFLFRKKSDLVDIKIINNEIVGQIKWNNHEMVGQNVKIERGNFVVIHQGILDKIYDRYIPKGVNNDELKQQIDMLFNSLKRIIKADYYVIHSGRSKPPVMPSGTSFLQYASLENSFYDCKFTLTELLYSTIIDG